MYSNVLPHQTQHSFQHDIGDETKVVYSEVKLTPEVKEEVSAQVDEKVKEATQTTEGMQRDEGELADQCNEEEMGEEESECRHVMMMCILVRVLVLPNCLRYEL